VEIKTSIQVVIGVEVKPKYRVGDYIKCQCGGKGNDKFCGVEGEILYIDKEMLLYTINAHNTPQDIHFKDAYKPSKLEMTLK
jgi:hypothetical protein